jgi:hypothetical protein
LSFARNISREEPPKSLHTTAASNVGSIASCRSRRHPKATLFALKPTIRLCSDPKVSSPAGLSEDKLAVRRGQSECYAQPQAARRGARCQPVHRSGLAVTYGLHVRYPLASKNLSKLDAETSGPPGVRVRQLPVAHFFHIDRRRCSRIDLVATLSNPQRRQLVPPLVRKTSEETYRSRGASTHQRIRPLERTTSGSAGQSCLANPRLRRGDSSQGSLDRRNR